MKIAVNFLIALTCCTVLVIAVDEHRPNKKEKRNLQYSINHHYTPQNFRSERRISNNGPPTSPYATGGQYFNGGPPRKSYRNNLSQFVTPPPYLEKMEPIVRYSQKLYDEVPHTNQQVHQDTGSNESNQLEDPIDRGGKGGHTIYIPSKPFIKYVEKPVYIKEPEPIIEIIIKESNVTLPPPPTEPPLPPPKNKKEEVQVFYVKYKKNPGGYGKDAIIYDKPVPAIAPPIPEEPEPEEVPEYKDVWNESDQPLYGPPDEPPKPSTTLRTIIKPDSEIYHSPGNQIKVTFGKEGFDYGKRESKPEDYAPPSSSENRQSFNSQENSHNPNERARQLSSFSEVYYKRLSTPPNFGAYQSGELRSESRPPQNYRPFDNFPQRPPQFSNKPPSNGNFRGPPPPFFPQPKFNNFPSQSFNNRPPARANNFNTGPPSSSFNNGPPPSQQHSSRPSFPPSFSHSISHPPPPQFQAQRPKFSQPVPTFTHNDFNEVPPPSQRKPVPYTPFEHIKPTFSQPLQTVRESFNPIQPGAPTQPTSYHPIPQQQPHQQKPNNIQFRPESRFPTQQQLPTGRPSSQFKEQSFAEVNNQFKTVQAQSRPQQQPSSQHQNQPFRQLQQNQQHQLHQQHQQHQQQQSIANFQHSQQQQQLAPQYQGTNGNLKEHLNNIQSANVIPPGGELIQSLPKFEQHLFVDPATGQLSQSLPLSSEQRDFNGGSQQNINSNNGPQGKNSKSSSSSISADEAHEVLKQHFQSVNPQNVVINQQRTNEHQIYTLQNSISSSTGRPAQHSTTQRSFSYSTSKQEPSSTTPKVTTTTKDPKILEAQLPDEVPDDLREQLLSSGILNNADISILDYDKVGDIPLSALPPDQLANFYGAGGAAQIGSESNPVPQVVRVSSSRRSQLYESSEEQEGAESEVMEVKAEDAEPEESKLSEVRAKPDNVEMKVVKYDPDTEKGQQLQEAYISDDAKRADPVVLNDQTYNRYLPLKINGTQFPIPDIPALKDKKISSVVVLAPISYDFSGERKARDTSESSKDKEEEARISRELKVEARGIDAETEDDFIQDETLKRLLVDPTTENFKKFLEKENNTVPAKQSVILLVASDSKTPSEKEIYMFDVASRSVNKLSGELSSAFVQAAEANSADDYADGTASASSIIETRVPFGGNMQHFETVENGENLENVEDLDGEGSNVVERTDDLDEDNDTDQLSAQGAENFESQRIMRIPARSVS